jgi:hypothetical protein
VRRTGRGGPAPRLRLLRPPFLHFMNARYKFQNLETYKLALEYLDRAYDLTAGFPERERFNLRSQLERAATSVVLKLQTMRRFLKESCSK